MIYPIAKIHAEIIRQSALDGKAPTAEIQARVAAALQIDESLIATAMKHTMEGLAAQAMLYGIHIPGPDEHYAAPSQEAAQHMAERHNTAMAEWYAAHPDPEGHGPRTEHTTASVVVWPFSPEDHTKDLTTFNAAEWGWTEPKGAA